MTSLEVDAEIGEAVDLVAGRVHVFGEGEAGGAVVLEGVVGLGGHGADGFGADQLVDVEGVGVGGVLDADGGPQGALDAGTLGSQLLEVGLGEDLLEGSVGVLGVGDGDLALQGLKLGLLGGVGFFLEAGVDALVDLDVDAGDEEAGDGGDAVDGQAGVGPALEGLDVGAGDLFVGVDAEEEGDVDVDAVEEGLFDGGQALRWCRGS